jgi:putative ABC transport system permease protein
MMLLHRLVSMLSWLFRRSSAEQHLDDELQTFIDMSAAAKMRDGLPPAEARRLAILELGGVEQAKERVRTARHGALLDEVGRDMRYALRTFVKQRGFTVVVVLTLALGIGANTAIFSIVDGLLLRTLPVKEPGRLAILLVDGPSGQTTWTYPIWEQIQQRADVFDSASAWSRFDAQFNLSQGGETQLVSGMWVSANTFSTLGVTTVLGRTFMPADDVRGGGATGPVAVISHAFWQRHFGGAPDVVGRTLTLERIPFTVIGVTQPGFFGLSVGRSYDVAIPFGVEPLVRGGRESRLDRRTSWWLAIMVRLKPGQTIQQATTVLRGLQPQIREATLPPQLMAAEADEYLGDPFALAPAASGRSELRRQYQRPLIVIMVVVGLVLLIACANIANLLLARATARGHEWSLRLALGASRGRLARQLLTESLLLAAMGAAAGLIVAQWGSRLLVDQLASDSVFLELTLDWRVLAFTATVTIVAALVFGVAPAVRATRRTPVEAIKDQGRSNSAGRRVSIASGFVVAQVILSVVLVVCAGLFLRTFSSLVHAPLGFDRDRVLLVDVDARRSGIPPEALAATYDRMRQRVLAVPGVRSAGVSLVTPLGGAMWSRRVEVSGSSMTNTDRVDGPEGFGFTDAAIPESSPLALFNAVTPGWLSTYGTAVVAGRDISERDGRGAAGVALVNQAFARKFLNGANPIGHTVRTTRVGETSTREIVGLVTDAVYRSVRDPILPTVYVPLAQYDAGAAVTAPPAVTLSVRATSHAPATLTKSVAAAIAESSPTLALTIRPLADQVNDTLTQERLLAMLSASFGALALLMAAVGLYGVTSYAVSLQQTEIGIRMALGATRGAVMRLVLGRVSSLVGIGIVVGLALGAWASRFVATLLFGLEPGDPVTLIAAAVSLAVIGAVAGWLPAHRASRLDPARVLSEI